MWTSSMQKQSPTKMIETPVCSIHIDEYGIVHTRFRHGAQVDIEEMKVIEQALFQITENQPFKTVMDLRNKFVNFDVEARSYAAKGDITKNITAQVFLVNTLPMKMITNFFLRFDSPKYPTRAFQDEEKAISWLESK